MSDGRSAHNIYRPGTLQKSLWLAFICLQLLLAGSISAQTANTTEELTRESTFIFRGTVEKTNASTLAVVKPSERTAAVRVDEVIDGPGAPPDLVGHQITLQLREPGSLKVGQQAVFFTKGWLMGPSIAVVEVGRQQEPSSTLHEQVRGTRQKIADEQLQTELLTSEAVILGKVLAVRPSKIPHLPTEHDPDWYEARVGVEKVLKGELREREITLLFAHSDDVMWRTSPKYKEGQTGIFLLHRNQARLPNIENQLTTLKPLDFRPAEEIDRVERLLKSTQ
jgi:hypothetical protein